jgi:hypothetical protein
MPRDVAQRELDQAGFRISNLGNPSAPGDATSTDNLTVPLRSRRDGSPGASVLAAAADHVHPLGPDLITLSDPAQHNVGTRIEVWFGVVNFDDLVGDRVIVGLSSMLQTCFLLLWLDGEVGNPTAGTLIMNLDSASPDLVPVAAVSSNPFPRPTGAHLLTLTAEPLSPALDGQTLGRVITLRGLGG